MRTFVRSFATLVALLVAYQVYVLVAVPVLEPPLAARRVQHSTEADRQRAEQAMTKYQRLLAAYFSGGPLVADPAAEGDQDGRRPRPDHAGVGRAYPARRDGRVDLERCALLYFPTPPIEGGDPPRDAIVIEAPQGCPLPVRRQVPAGAGRNSADQERRAARCDHDPQRHARARSGRRPADRDARRGDELEADVHEQPGPFPAGAERGRWRGTGDSFSGRGSAPARGGRSRG